LLPSAIRLAHARVDGGTTKQSAQSGIKPPKGGLMRKTLLAETNPAQRLGAMSTSLEL